MKALPFSSSLSVLLCSLLVITPVYGQAPTPGSVNISAAPDALQLRVVDLETVQSKSQAGGTQTFSVEVTDSSGTAVPSAAVTCRLPDSGPTGTFADGTHAAVAYTDASGRATFEPVHWGDVPGDVGMRLTATKGTVHTGILVQANLAAAPHVSGSSENAVPVPRETTIVTVPTAKVTEPAASAQPTVIEPVVSVTKPNVKSTQEPGQVAPKAAPADPGPDKLTPSAVEPSVSVSRTSAADAPHSSHAKWYVLALVGVAAAAGAGMAMRGHSGSSSTTPSASIAIGTPTVSVGH